MENSKKMAEEYLNRIPLFTGKNNPEKTADFYRYVTTRLPLPEKTKIIHVAGTNGKGSVCAYLRAILMEAGFFVGMFTSPHLVDIRERFQIGKELVPEQMFVESFQVIKELVACYRKEQDSEYHPAYFEFLFFMLFPIFRAHPVNYLIVETGLGGRLDATNQIPNPVVSIITRIGYDHMQYLGETLPQIATEKAGILKRNVPAVFFQERESVFEVLNRKVLELDIPVITVSKQDYAILSFDHKSIDFSYRSHYYGFVRCRLATGARYQVTNASLAIAAIEAMGIAEQIPVDTICAGLQKAFWAGRMEELMPGVVVDGAHNEDGIEAFLDTVRSDGFNGERKLIFSVVSDKRSESMIRMIMESDLFGQIIIVKLKSERGLSEEEIQAKFLKYNCKNKQITVRQDIHEALDTAISISRSGGLVYIVGSLYLVGQVKEMFVDMGKAMKCDD